MLSLGYCATSVAAALGRSVLAVDARVRKGLRVGLGAIRDRPLVRIPSRTTAAITRRLEGLGLPPLDYMPDDPRAASEILSRLRRATPAEKEAVAAKNNKKTKKTKKKNALPPSVKQELFLLGRYAEGMSWEDAMLALPPSAAQTWRLRQEGCGEIPETRRGASDLLRKMLAG